ncbi:DgyrCDS3148 [Dimorphilus gyrociliatus]|uniref:Beta-1,4-galactosyltransferase n=1 Tax=Dimorphilus gyrociliatus TaxID=2664684 RepID=A0A7I8VF28_9ANNE|nr:DgyrCDS3148 [Dimorphilus gyrociliatus]
MRLRSFRSGSFILKFGTFLLFIELFYVIHLIISNIVWTDMDGNILFLMLNKEHRIDRFLKSYEGDCEISLRKQNLRKNTTLCDCLPSVTEHKITINTARTPTWNEIANKYNKTLSSKGEYKPNDCEPLQSVAIIIPYMKRDSHLKILINHLHFILPRQKIHYRIFVIEQNSPSIFNKAAIMNIGFVEAGKLFNFTCSIFHDVDMLAEDGRNMYNCLYSPRHIGSHVNKYGYRLFYNELIGGALAITPKHFRRVNGYSTSFYGWGGEDDDMKNRLSAQSLKITRFPKEISRFTMLKHEQDKHNPTNKFRRSAVDTRKLVYEKDGLNSLNYSIVETRERSLFTLIKANLYISQHNQFNKIKGSCKETRYFLTKSISTDSIEDCSILCYNDQRCLSFDFYANYCRKHFKPCVIEDSNKENRYVYDKKEKSKYLKYFIYEQIDTFTCVQNRMETFGL